VLRLVPEGPADLVPERAGRPLSPDGREHHEDGGRLAAGEHHVPVVLSQEGADRIGEVAQRRRARHGAAVVTFGPQGPDTVARILTFTSAPLDDDLEVVGPIKLVLHAASSNTDTDF